MYDIIYRYHQNHTFTMNGYQVRLVNSLTAYDYISDNLTVNRITYAMQRCKIDETVHNLLKLALLKEHGGVIINNADIVFPNSNLSWIEGLFTSHKSSTLKKYNISNSIS